MVGVGGNRFDPNGLISEAMTVTALARLAEADLSQYEETGSDRTWYSSAVAWAENTDLLDGSFSSAQGPQSRGELAIMLVRYLEAMQVPYTKPETATIFADASAMTAEEAEAFQILYHLGIFQGKGNGVMDPEGATTRAELAALLHRLAVFLTLDGED